MRINGTLTSLNEYINANRRNRFKGASIKKRDTEIAQWCLKGSKPLKNAPQHLIFMWYMPNKKKDPDNIAFAKKFILDAMVKEGILENDGWKQVSGFTDLFFVDPENPRVEIESNPKSPLHHKSQ